MLQDKSNEKYSIVVLVIFQYKCWSNSTEKIYLIKNYENEKVFRQEMSKSYHRDNLFQSTKLNENISMVKYKENIFSKI